jgi:hypothetical protein
VPIQIVTQNFHGSSWGEVTCWTCGFHRTHFPSPYNRYSRISSTKSPSICMKTFSASLTNLMALVPQSEGSSCILAPPSLWPQKHTDLRARHAVGQLVETLCCKPEDHGVDSRWYHWNFSLTYSFLSYYGRGVCVCIHEI